MVRSKIEDFFDSRYVAPNPENSPVAPSPFALAVKTGPTNKISQVTSDNEYLGIHLSPKYRQISITMTWVVNYHDLGGRGGG